MQKFIFGIFKLVKNKEQHSKSTYAEHFSEILENMGTIRQGSWFHKVKEY